MWCLIVCSWVCCCFWLYMTKLLQTTIFFFFFQAEDGIRDHCVTGVQTCALPICAPRRTVPSCSSDSSLALTPSPSTDDVAVRLLALLARAVAECRHTPRRDRMAPRGRRALAAAVRMVDWVHRRAARLGTHAHVALAPRLADLDVLVVCVADRADGRPALAAHHPHLARGQAQGHVVALLGQQLDAGPG